MPLTPFYLQLLPQSPVRAVYTKTASWGADAHSWDALDALWLGAAAAPRSLQQEGTLRAAPVPRRSPFPLSLTHKAERSTPSSHTIQRCTPSPLSPHPGWKLLLASQQGAVINGCCGRFFFFFFCSLSIKRSNDVPPQNSISQFSWVLDYTAKFRLMCV